MTKQPNTQRSTHVATLLLAMALLAIVGCGSATVDHSEPAALSRDVVAQVPSADFDPLDKLGGLPVSFAAIDATVADVAGPTVELRSDGYVDYEVDESGRFPAVRLAEIEFRHSLDSSDLGRTNIDQLHAQIAEGDLFLFHSDGYFEVGKRYTFFIGYWSPAEFSVLYAYSDENESPAPGFSSEKSDLMLDRITKAYQQQKESAATIDALVQFSIDLHAEEAGAERSKLTESALGPTSAEHDPSAIADGYYPTGETDLRADQQIGEFVQVELLIIVDVGRSAEYALQGQELLGWFGTNDLGYSIVSGLVPAGESLRLVERAAGAEEYSPVDSDRISTDGQGISLTADPPFELALLDLSSSGRSGLNPLTVFESQDQYFEILESLQPILDGTIEGPEPKDE